MGLLNRGDGVSFGPRNRAINGATIDVLDDNGYRIGYLSSIAWTTSRRLERLRHLSSEDAGRVIEIVPGTEDFSCTLVGYSLYDKGLTDRGSLINRLGSSVAAIKTLMGQREPFHLVVKAKHPTTGEVAIRRFFDCWLSGYGETRSIGNTTQTESASCIVGQVE